MASCLAPPSPPLDRKPGRERADVDLASLHFGAAAEHGQQRDDDALQPSGRRAHALQARPVRCLRFAQGDGELRIDAGERRAQGVRSVRGEGALVRDPPRQPAGEGIDGGVRTGRSSSRSAAPSVAPGCIGS